MRLDSGLTEVPTAGTAVQLLNTKDKIAWICFTAPGTNKATVYVGDSAVSSSNGYPLPAHRHATRELPIPVGGSITANKIWVDAAESGDDVGWIALLT